MNSTGSGAINLTLNDPLQNGTNGRTLILSTSTNITGYSGSTITIGGGQTGASTGQYSYVELQPATNGVTYSINPQIIMNGTGTGGFVDLSNNGNNAAAITLAGGVQIATTNVATVVLGGAQPTTGNNTLTINGINCSSSSNTSAVLFTNKLTGSGKIAIYMKGSSNYYGPTYLGENSGFVFQCLNNSCLSANSVYTPGISTSLVSGAASGQGANFDLNGTSQTIAGVAIINGGTGEILNSATNTPAALTIAQNSNTAETFSLPILNGTGTSTTSLTLTPASGITTSSLTLTSTSNTFTGGLTLNANANLIAGANNTLPATLPVTLNGGSLTLNVGATAYSQGSSASPLGALSISGSPSINMGNGTSNSNSIYFSSIGTMVGHAHYKWLERHCRTERQQPYLYNRKY